MTSPPTDRETLPICVDMDGTLLKTDLLWESALRLLAARPLYLFVLPFWLLAGTANFAAQLAKRVTLDPSSLPFHTQLLEFLQREHANGRRLLIVTRMQRLMVEPVARHLAIFSEVLVSDAQTDMRGPARARYLSNRFGRHGFGYAGSSRADLPVWRESRNALVIGTRYAQIPGATVFPSDTNRWRQIVRSIRPHQWMKNLILFVPILTAHELDNAVVMAKAANAFMAFSLCASGLYVFNDLLDLDADRHHFQKKQRPFAAGDVPLWIGFVLAPLLLAGGTAVALALPAHFLMILAGYALLNLAYSMRIKRIVLLDVFCLAGLYTIRLVGGHEATGVAYSSWLLMFSMFIFLSLALSKRFQELHAMRRQNRSGAEGRGYGVGDLELVASLGTSSGYLAILVLGLYVNSDQVQTLYQYPQRLLLICPLLLYWVSRIWLVAHRGELLDDPVLFTLRDRVSYFIGGLILLVIWLATGR